MKAKLTLNKASFRLVKAEVKKQLRSLDLVAAAMSASEPIIEEAKRTVPVDSGALRDSLMAEKEKMGSTKWKVILKVGHDKRMARPHGKEVRVPVTYAAAIEMGSKSPNPRPYLRPALDNNRKRALEAAAATILKQLRSK